MTHTCIISLGRFSTNMNLEVTFLDENGNAATTTYTPIELGNGRYMVTVDLPIERGVIVVTDLDRDAVLQVGAVQPQGLPKIRRTKQGLLPSRTPKDNTGHKHFPALDLNAENVFYED